MNPILTVRRAHRAGPGPRLSRAVLRSGTTNCAQQHGAHANQPSRKAVPAVAATGRADLVDRHLTVLTAPGQNGGQAR